MRMRPGQEFMPDDVRTANDRHIDIIARADGRTIGGMTYPVDPQLKRPPLEHPPKGRDSCLEEAQELLDCLEWPSGKVKSVRVKRITVDIDLKTEDC